MKLNIFVNISLIIMKKKFKNIIRKPYRTMQIFFQYGYKYFISQIPNTDYKPTIQYMADGLVYHGGLVDRLKGIITCYELSKRFNVEFKLLHNSPINLHEYLLPNQVNWVVQHNNKNFLTHRIKYFISDTNTQKFIDSCNNNKYNLIYTNIELMPYLYGKRSDEEWRNNFWELFKISNKLIAKYEKVINRKKPYITIHLRFGSLNGDYIESFNKIWNQNEKNNFHILLMNRIDEIYKTYSMSLFIATDSMEFRDKVLDKYDYTFSSDVIPDSFNLENSLLDFYIISKSEKVIQLKIDQMYIGGFSKYASILYDIEYQLEYIN